MYKFYIVPDATQYNSHSELYANMKLFYDPYAESDAYAVITPKTKNELNKAGSLEFTVLPSNIHYGDFYKKKSVVIVFDEDTWLYEGVVTDAPTDFFKQRKVTCSGPLSFLCDSVQAPDERNVIEIPTSSSGTRYFAVPDTWLAGANPNALQWYVQQVQSDNSIRYVRTNDQVVVSGTRYFYPVAGDGANYSGATTLKSAGVNETIIAHITRLLEVHNSQVDPFKRIFPGRMYNSSDSEIHEFKASNFRDTWDALKSDIMDAFGRYFTITRGNDNNLYLNYLELAQLPSSVVPDIEFTNNLIEINESNNQDDGIFTVLVPYGKDNLTVAGVSGHNSPSNSNLEVSPYIASWGGNRQYVVVSPKAVQRYGHIIKSQQFGDIEDANKLYTEAVNYINNNYDYHPEYEVKAIDIRFINGSGHRILVGDKCHLKSTWHGINTQDLYVISAEHDLVNPENDSYRFGIPTSDREAKNRTLSSQTKAATSKAARNQASTSSGMSRMHSILEDYIHVTEWGLEMSTNLKNQVESNDGKYMTRFIQDEQYINLAAQKLFGIDDENGHGSPDAGYAAVPKNEYRDSKGALKNPKEQNWFEKDGTNSYVLSNDTEANESKTYYYQRLWTRYSNFDVGPGGIKATVDGNHERSTYCSSWIGANETQIIAITGHIHVDSDGQVIIDAGAGARTGYTSERTEVHYVAVQQTLYGNSPRDKGWYERVMDSSGRWPGTNYSEDYIMQGATPNTFGSHESQFYKRSNDAVANRNKAYYIRQTAVEEFVSEYGLYDENTLHGGVISRMVNNPQFFPVSDDEVRKAGQAGHTAYEHGWYLYIQSTGEFQQATPGIVVNPYAKNTYYKRKNTGEYYTDVWGEHIVIGRTINYSGMSAANQAKVAKYLANNRIDGTVTEIASDIVVVDTLLAKYIEADDITVNTSLWTDHLHANRASIEQHLYCPEIVADDIWWRGNAQHDPSDANSLKHNTIMVFATENDVNRTILSSVSGDEVTISFMTMDGVERSVTFIKPASIGRAVWSSGGGGTQDLKVYTIGGWNNGSPEWSFYHAVVSFPTNYVNGSLDSAGNPLTTYGNKGSDVGASVTSGLRDKPTIKARVEFSGDDYDRYGNAVAFIHGISEDSPIISAWSKDIFIDATSAYNDGWGHAEDKVEWPSVMQALGERTRISIKYPSSTVNSQNTMTLGLVDNDTKGTSGYVKLYKDYSNDSNPGSMIGAIDVGDWYSSGYDQGLLDATPELPETYPIESYEESNVSVWSVVSNGSRGSSKILGIYTDTYRRYGSSSSRNCVVVRDGSVNVGRLDIQGMLDDYEDSGEKSGWNSCRAAFLTNGDVYNVESRKITASDVGKTLEVKKRKVDPGAK